MNFITRLRAGLDRFMTGRYGSDALNRFLMILWIVLAVIGLIAATPWLYIPQAILCAVVFFRMLSKNVVRRRRENAVYCEWMRSLGLKWRHFTVRIRDRKVANFFRCPHCKAEIRMPKRSGRFQIRCPKCGQTFPKEFK